MKMKKILITGGAGFIGSHVVRRFVKNYPDYLIINIDKLTYAGNLENLRDIEKKENYQIERVDIVDKNGITALFRKYSFDGMVWRWDNLSTIAWPHSCSHGKMVYEPLNNRMVFFGGKNLSGGLFSHTWYFYGFSNQWAPNILTVDAPSARHSFSLSYDSFSNEIILFGGCDSTGAKKDFWILYDDQWKVREAAVSALGKIGDQRAIVPLSGALQDRSNNVRKEAAEALGKFF